MSFNYNNMDMSLSKKSKRALVLGAAGQDGTLLCDSLLKSGYRVLGIGRSKGKEFLSAKYSFKIIDLRESELLAQELNNFKPNVIFHVAAVHGSAGIDYEEIWGDAILVNTVSVHVALEYMRRTDPECKLIYASSSKIFGGYLPKIINEQTKNTSSCLYSITKNATFDLIEFYRNKYALKASVVYLFNHESKYRQAGFFIPTILESLASAVMGKDDRFNINSLRFYCDWGSAEEYMNIVIKIYEKSPGEDFVLGTGKCFYAKDLVDKLFQMYDLNYADFINEIDNKKVNSEYCVDTSKLREYVGIEPKRDIIEVCKDILLSNYGI